MFLLQKPAERPWADWALGSEEEPPRAARDPWGPAGTSHTSEQTSEGRTAYEDVLCTACQLWSVLGIFIN